MNIFCFVGDLLNILLLEFLLKLSFKFLFLEGQGHPDALVPHGPDPGAETETVTHVEDQIQETDVNNFKRFFYL